jgi:hypothetical protein
MTRSVRMAIARNAQLESLGSTTSPLLQHFVDTGNLDEIVITMNIEAPDTVDRFRQLLIDLRTPDLVRSTYLVTDDGIPNYLKRYDPPAADGAGAKFVFSRRLLDGTPFVKPTDRQLRFETTLSLADRQSVRALEDSYSVPQNLNRISIKFDLRKMMFEGKLEI